MTDSTFPIFSLPQEILTFIASYLTLEELAQFRQVCRAFHTLGSNASLLQPHYNRLKALDPTLPALLPTNISPPLAFKEAFEKVRDAQIKEIDYLTKHHSTLVAQHLSAALALSTTTIEQLEQRNSALDAINSAIIENKINTQGLNSRKLGLFSIGITRMPISLFKKPGLVEFWQNLTFLSCGVNALTSLNLQCCSALEYLWCSKNALTTLNLQGCSALQILHCSENKITTLNLQGLTALYNLNCPNNALTTLNLQGCSVLQRLLCDKSSLTELNLEGTPEKLRAEFARIIEALRVKQLPQVTLNQAPIFLHAFNNSAAPLPPQGIKRPAEENSEEEKFETQDSDSKSKRQKP